jgi:demethylmenaquinone methyltransferase / 2-methoxy-6-polyprenyl-1,4-benzoquinol methylase
MVMNAPTPGSPETGRVRAMFDHIAPRYDLLNRVLSGGLDLWWRRAALRALAPPADGLLLDLCTGTGDVILAALSRRAGCHGVGLDLSRKMLRLARAKAERRGLGDRLHLVQGDATRLPLADGSVGGASVAFGLRNVADVQAVLGEVARVLVPGGVFVVLELTLPSGLWGRLYRFYFARILPRIGGLVSAAPDAYGYLPASVARFAEGPLLEHRLRAAGFCAVTSRPLALGVVRLYRAARPGPA